MNTPLDVRDFKDHFSTAAAAYTRFRPTYPAALFTWLAGLSGRRELAWDCGCGNGQAALGLAPHFDRVTATDPSREQIANALPHPRVRYAVATAENSGLESSSVDLVTVAQALHWFDLERFYGGWGFARVGEPYLEDGIPHLEMFRPAGPQAPVPA